MTGTRTSGGACGLIRSNAKNLTCLLYTSLQEKAKESGVERIVLEARVTNEAAISLYQKMGFVNPVSYTHLPILVDKYLMGKEIEVDAICDGTDILMPGIMEHIERTGVHSGCLLYTSF